MPEPLRVFVAMPEAVLGEHTRWTEPEEIEEELYGGVKEMLEERLGREVDMEIERDRQMSGEALTAPVYIADLTGASATVHLELGVRWALRDNVTIVTCQHRTDLRFDADTYRYARYGQEPEELRAAKELIVTMIVNGLDDPGFVDSPVRQGRDPVVRESNDTRADVHGELGKELRDAGDVSGAIVHLRRATELDKGNAGWWRELGVAQSRRGDLVPAVESLTEAVRLDPSGADAYSSLGGAHRRIARDTGDVAELRKARDCYHRASEIKPGEIYSLANVARLDVLLANDADERAAAVEKFRKLNPLARWLTDDKPADWAWLDLADTFAFRGDTGEAVKALRQGMAQFPPDNRASTAKIALEPVRDMLAVGWLPDDVAASLQALVSEYEKYAT